MPADSPAMAACHLGRHPKGINEASGGADNISKGIERIMPISGRFSEADLEGVTGGTELGKVIIIYTIF